MLSLFVVLIRSGDFKNNIKNNILIYNTPTISSGGHYVVGPVGLEPTTP